MTTTIYARTTAHGTAASETAVCAAHLDQADNFPYDSGYRPEEISDPSLVDCSGNEALECQVCGATATPQAYTFAVTVTAGSADQARQVMVERIGHDEDLGFDYSIDWSDSGNA